MKPFRFLASILALITIISCNSGSGETKTVTTPVTTPNLPVPSTNSTPVTTPNNSATVSTSPNAVSTNPTALVPTTNNSTAALNPAHGQPNHRCDIPVGAPLDSKPAPAPTQTVTNTTPVNSPIQVSPNQATPTQVVTTTQGKPKTVTAPGMNPPHGEPNHRCDIAVGAPLSTAPVINSKRN